MAQDHAALEFPDGPRSDLDQALGSLVESANRVLATQGRLRSLLKASRVVADELDLPVVLRRIIEAAVELVGARYGAIGVIAPDGTLQEFIHVGMPEELVGTIGHLPQGHGILGALTQEQEPIRLEHLNEDPRSIGFPAGHPPMDSFLGVPVRVRGEIYGNLYLTEQAAGSFSDEDQQLLIALAATAGAAIDHARLFDESRRRQRWSAASAEVTAALLSEQAGDSLAVIAERVAVLAEADVVTVTLPAADTLMLVEVARGELAGRLSGLSFARGATLVGRAFESGQPVLAEPDAENGGDPHLALGATMALPLASADDPMGVLTVTRAPHRPRFTTADLDMAADFAAQAGVALRLAAAQAGSQRLALLEDRGRIARDLHDNVIQRLFGAGLSLQAVAGAVQEGATRDRITQQIETLDVAIAEIRTAIFTMTAQADASRPSLRHRVIDVLGETADLFAESPRLSFSGAVDLMVPQDMIEDVVAVVREGLSNVARHAGATASSVTVSVDERHVTIEIVDDGRGFDPATAQRSSGTSNLAERASARGGQLRIRPGRRAGTELTWRVPYPRGGQA